jgi:hypothetical protein
MARNRITWGGATLAVLLIAGIFAGCGGGRASTTALTTPAPSQEESADAAILDTVLARQEAAVEALAEVGPALPPRLARMAAYFRAQEQEHVDSVLKALRGLGGEAEVEPEAIEVEGLKSVADHLRFLYELESATIDLELSAIAKLTASWPRSLLASTVADQAQHLTLLRGMLGARPIETVPGAFENGTAPAP